MKHYKSLAWTLATAIAGLTLTACSLDSYEPEKPILIIDPVEVTLYACGISPSETHLDNILFTEDDIEWFNVTTREIKFKDMDEPLYKRLVPFHEIEFHLGDDALFVVSSFVGDWDSRIFTDLVLHYQMNSDTHQGHYYLHDCYPPQFINDERTQANLKKNVGQWELFVYYLESKGKLKK